MRRFHSVKSEAWVQSRRLKQSAGIRSPKFTEAQKVEICGWLAHFMQPADVIKRVQAEWQITVTVHPVYHLLNHPKWRPTIDRFRAEWVRGIMQEPIAHKRTRLQKLSHLIECAELDRTTSSWRQRFEVAKYLDQARLEMDEKQTNVSNLFITQVNQLNEAELLQRRKELLEKITTWRPSNALRSEEPQTGVGPGCEGRDQPASEAAGQQDESSQHPA